EHDPAEGAAVGGGSRKRRGRRVGQDAPLRAGAARVHITFALVVRRDAEEVRTISDLAKHPGEWRAGFGYEFQERADGYPGLARAYGLQFGEIRIMRQRHGRVTISILALTEMPVSSRSRGS